MHGFQRIILAFATLACLVWARPAAAYVEIPYTLGRLVSESTNVMLMRVEKVDKEKNLIIYTKVADIKGKHPQDVIRHNIGRGGFHPREWQTIMAWAEVGKTAVFVHNGAASETCIDKYWYQAYAGGDWWSMSHAEPYMLRSFAGRPEKLAQAVTDLVADREVVVPCMEDGDKNALQLGTARVMRMKASLKLIEYDTRRDFVGWGGDDFRMVKGMPAFSHVAEVGRADPGARGVKVHDFDGDGAADFCLYGDARVALMQIAGTAMNEVSLPYAGGARSAEWADYNGDAKPDLLLATDSGPRLFTNGKDALADDSGGLPHEDYYNTTAAAWLDYDNDKRPDILLSNGFLGLRLYRNLGPDAPKEPVGPSASAWHYAGPFDYAGGRGFDTAYPPEQGIDLSAKYTGKGGTPVQWKEGKFTDAQINSLMPLFSKPEHQNDVCIYLYREFNFGGAVEVPISLGSDDTLTVWLNGEKVLSENVQRGCTPDSNLLTLKMRGGKNQLLLKICQGSGDFAFYFAAKADLPKAVPPLFADVSQEFGLGPMGIAGSERASHFLTGDFNADGRTDVICGTATPRLLLNTAKGFVESKDAGLSYKSSDVSPLVADVDGDGKVDLLVLETNRVRLLRNAGGKFVDDSAKLAGIPPLRSGLAGGTWVDFDRDGKADLLLGRIRGTNLLLKNLGGGKFEDGSAALGFQQKIFNSRAIAAGDLNKDGAADLVLANEGQQSTVLLGAPNPKVASGE